MAFLIIFIIIPLVELAIFIAVSDLIGLGTALLLVLLSAIVGGGMVRHQGLQTLASVSAALEQGRVPLSALFDGICLVAAGALLIVPGFLTDMLGILLLVPSMRAFLRGAIRDHTDWGLAAPEDPVSHPSVIEGEYERVERPDEKP